MWWLVVRSGSDNGCGLVMLLLLVGVGVVVVVMRCANGCCLWVVVLSSEFLRRVVLFALHYPLRS